MDDQEIILQCLDDLDFDSTFRKIRLEEIIEKTEITENRTKAILDILVNKKLVEHEFVSKKLVEPESDKDGIVWVYRLTERGSQEIEKNRLGYGSDLNEIVPLNLGIE